MVPRRFADRPRVVFGSFLLISLVLLSLAPVATAQPFFFDPGISLFDADPSLSYIDFAQHPIPADFFGPGSDPFLGMVALRGVPLAELPECPITNLLGVSAVLERQGTIELPVLGSSVIIPVEMIAMDLVSVSPITVTFGGGKRAMNFDVHAKPTPPPPGDDWARLQFEANLADEIGSFSVSYLNSLALETPRITFYYTEMGSDELVAIMLDIAVSMPLLIVQKESGSKKRRAACDPNFCMNKDNPLLLMAPGIQIALNGVCEPGPVANEVQSWGSAKARF